MFRIPCILLAVLLAVPATAQVEPYDLSVEYMNAPVGIDTPKPRLSWKSRATDPTLKNVVQTAYQVLVASTPENLDKNVGDLWDSGKVESDQSLNIEYAGKPLETSQRCHWKVQVWYSSTSSAQPLAASWSAPSRWIMGVMHPEDWKAQWIASDEKFRPDFDMGDAKWIWTGDATDLSVAPAGKRYYRTEFNVDGIFFDMSVRINQVVLAVTADDEYKVFINGQPATQTWGHFNDWKWMRFIDVTQYINKGKNIIAVEVTNKTVGPTGLLLRCTLKANDLMTGTPNAVKSIETDGTSGWTSSAEPTEGWNSDPNFMSEKWKPAVEVGPVDCEPWGKIERRWETVSPAFGKSFDVDKKVKTATLHITGLGFYEASLNGKRIGNKVLDPMQTRYDKRVLYSTYDLTDSLKQGENRLNVLVGHGWYDVRSVAVWNFDNAPWRDFCRMLAQLEIVYDDGSKQMVVSDDSWDQVESPILFDCIRQGEFSRSQFVPAHGTWSSYDTTLNVIGKAAVTDAPKGKLVAEAVPPSIIAQELKPVKVTEPKPGIFVVDFGQNIAGWIRLKIDGKYAGAVIQCKYTERLDKDGNVDMKPINAHFRHRFPFPTPETMDLPVNEEFQRRFPHPVVDKGKFPNDMFQIDTFFCRTGVGEIFENRFVYHGFQYVEITGLNAAPTAETITACMVHNDFKTVGKFECSNELFNKIQAATALSYKGNFVNGVPTDCPHREKNGWTGDAQLAVEQAQYNWENTACYEKWVRDLLDEQQPDGNLPGIVPTSGWGYQWGNGPAWDSALCIIPWTLYTYKADRRILEESYDGMKKYVDYLASRAKEDGLVYHGLSDWCPANTKTDAVVTSSIYYHIDALIVAQAARLLGKENDSKKYADLAIKIVKSYDKVLSKGDGVIANGSQVAQSFALYYGAIEPEKEKAVFAKLVDAVKKADDHLDVGILGAKSLFHTLSRYGRTDLAMKILNQKTAPGYGDWFERGATTLWEDWGDGASRNHIMFGDISTWFYRTLGGITPVGIAFKQSRITTEFPDGIDWAKAEHDSPYGVIKTAWKRDGKKIALNVSIPVNATAVYDGKELGSGEYSFEIKTP